MADKVKLLVLCGPTASGKTALAVELAKRLDGEIVSADSMQIYDGLPVGTAQPDARERGGVPHHLIGFLPLDRSFSVAQYVQLAAQCIEQIAARGKTPVVVGGTGLYVESLVEGVRFAPQQTNPAVREALRAALEKEGIGPLYARLAQIDPVYAGTLHPNNHGRVLRALELYEQTGLTMTQQRATSRPAQRPYSDCVVCLSWPREVLYRRIDERVERMLGEGLQQEAKLVYEHRDTYRTAAQAIGYKELFPWIEGREPLAPCAEALKQASRNYAKRQLTWFRRMPNVHWQEAGDPQAAEQILQLWQKAGGELAT